MVQNQELYDRFIRYVKIDTQSDEESDAQPSTEHQRNLADVLAEELSGLGLTVDYDRENCYVYGFLPARGEDPGEPLGFISHMDTSPECSDTDVKPRLIESYDGTDSLLKTEDFPELKNHFGEDLIATDGTTLLGADDKAGIAEIMTMLAWYQKHPEKSHRGIAVCFTPDEEIGRGTEHFDAARFGAARAYTVDGGAISDVEYECFNAAGARVKVRGKSVHTGSAKNVMKNAILIAMEFENDLPVSSRPENTEGREGFYHPDRIEGTVEYTEISYIIRDHDRKEFERKKQFLQDVADFLNQKYGAGTVEVQIQDQYYNMREILEKYPDLVDRPRQILSELGVTPVSLPIRGGTDGAMLCFRGIPCPNLPTGGYNYHSRYEYASVQEMETVVQLLIRLAAAA